MPKKELIDIAAELRHETNSAYLIFDGDKQHWLPKSLVEYDHPSTTFTMPEWLALEKGLI